jgi:NAD(P) transhydrogenase subunit alpha
MSAATDTPTSPAPTASAKPQRALSVGVLREAAPGERRVALTPDGVTRLQALGLRVVLEAGAGAGAWYPDEAYTAVGASVVDGDAVYFESDVLIGVHAPDHAGIASMRAGQALVGLLQPLVMPDLVRDLAAAHVTALSLDCLPRTLSSAQSMDVLTSQANVAGYKAALLAADVYGSYFPMLMTAAGTVRPAKVLVLGAGVAGLQAIGTARRLGAVVTAYDVREAARADVASTGAAFLDLATPAATARTPPPADGYARELSADEQHAQAAAMAKAIGTFDVVISTAQVPGRRPPVLVTSAAVAAMGAGSVLVDIASGPLGGNVEGSVPDMQIVTANGVTIIGAGNLAASLPRAASTAYSRNICALLKHLLREGKLTLDTSDAITAAVLITQGGAVLNPSVLALLGKPSSAAQVPQLAAIG